MTFLALVISVFSVLVSMTVAWITLLRRGTLHMTQPVQIAFVFENDKPKIFLRTLLYATGKHGYVIEGLYLKILRGEVNHTFGFWSYGERNELIVAGGLRISEDGAAFNHHFLDINEYSNFDFLEGEYVVETYARVANRSNPRLLSTAKLALSATEASVLRFRRAGVLFTRQPETGIYHPSLSPPRSA